MAGNRLTLGEFFKREIARHRAEVAAADADPEVQARRREHDAHERRMRDAEKRWQRENQKTPFEDGRDAAELCLPREPPDELDDDDSERWLAGFDSIGSDDD